MANADKQSSFEKLHGNAADSVMDYSTCDGSYSSTIDEAHCFTKGSNTVVSYLHHFFSNGPFPVLAGNGERSFANAIVRLNRHETERFVVRACLSKQFARILHWRESYRGEENGGKS